VEQPDNSPHYEEFFLKTLPVQHDTDHVVKCHATFNKMYTILPVLIILILHHLNYEQHLLDFCLIYLDCQEF
jgi:hypothetical protein